ncbi:MAG TPA: choice-of-anchor B family protein, partial [Bdellovibrionales bacterium]|nr:choice-of-anchor B family protein [Bdellovibrionales bacterium]
MSKLRIVVSALQSFGLISAAFTAVASAETIPCVNGRAGEYSCKNVDLQSVIDLAKSGLKTEGSARPPADPGDKKGSGSWGWTDPTNGREYAIMGLANKTSFVDISEPTKPVHVADLPAHSVGSLWREVNVINSHAVIVSESHAHGLQILDLTQLSKLSRDRVHILEETAHYGHFGSSHTISVNEKTGYAYALGSDTCDAGAHVVDLRNPKKPKFVTCIDRKVFDPLPIKPPQSPMGFFAAG